jgi:hypothetical protein
MGALVTEPRIESCRSTEEMLTADQIRRNYEAALEVAGRFFMGEAPVQLAARRIAGALRDLGVPHVVCGGLAVAAHGHLRVTQDVDILITPDGLRRFKDRWLGQGRVERFAGSRGLRDVEHDVRIDVLLTGDFPGDGRPGPIAFPDPRDCAVESSGVSILSLAKLIELKIASGLSAPARLQDWADVIALVRANALPAEYARELHPHVRPKYAELWALAQTPSGES